jgi:hypothetical protein
MDSGYIAIATVAWVLWCIHIMAYRRVLESPVYILYVWRVGIVTLPLLGGIAMSGPTGLLSAYMMLVCVAMIGMWAGTGCVVWCHLRRRGAAVEVR